MSEAFDAAQGLVIVRATVWGVRGSRVTRLALDTGASATLLNPLVLAALGYDLRTPLRQTQMTTGSGVSTVAWHVVSQFEALGQSRTDFAVIAHSLPPSAGVDGLLGLDFMRGLELTVDFRNGSVTLQ